MNVNLKKITLKLASVTAAFAIGSAAGFCSVFAVPVRAEGTDTYVSVVDYDKKGTVNIHKIIENDGNIKNADGLAEDGDYVAADNIGFDNVLIADIMNVTGIIVSSGGKIDWEQENRVSVGTYLIPNENLKLLMDASEVIPEATYIKAGLNTDTNTLTYEYNDEKAASLLIEEQNAVNAAGEELDVKRTARKEAQNKYTADVSASNLADINAASAVSAYEKAVAAQEAAAAEAGNAAQKATETASKLAGESTKYAQAATEMIEARSALDDASYAYQNADSASLKKLEEASLKLAEASNAAATAAENYEAAAGAKEVSAYVLSQAEEALTAAKGILQAAQEANESAAEGTSDSIDGTSNAIASAKAQLQAAQEHRDEAQTYNEEAEAALTEAAAMAQEAEDILAEATAAFNSAFADNDEKYGIFAEAVQKLIMATNTFNSAKAAQLSAQESYAAADAAKTAADNALSVAEAALSAALSSRNAAEATADDRDRDLSDSETTLNSAKSAYSAAKTAYDNAVEALDSKAEANGIVKVYTTEALETAFKQVITTMGEINMTEWVSENAGAAQANQASTFGRQSGGYTDDNGTVTFAGLDLGLYIFAETDISYHDGKAGAWNDAASGHINYDQMNVYADGKYTIQAIDAFGQETSHTYSYGDYYEESVNPEGPVIETPCAPFLVMVPTTNTTDTSADTVAAGDQYGQTGTVWQYTIDVYPKNQTTGIYKRIVDPDETDGTETLRTSEDYQIGDLIEQVIWADAPTLQPNYLNGTSDEGNGGMDGDLTDNTVADSYNKHLGYVISDNMSKGLTFDKVTKVTVIPKSQLMDSETTTTIYTDGDGTVVSASEALNADGSLKTTRKCYDGEGKEISAETFKARTGVDASAATAFSVTDNTGAVTEPGKTYNGTDGNTGYYYVKDVSYKQQVTTSTSSTIPGTVDAFNIVYDASEGEGFMLDAADYTVVNTDDEEVIQTNSAGDVQTVIDKGTHGFAVVLTESGLEKLNARIVDSTVVVYFDCILNKDAKIGEVFSNENHPRLDWVNTNTSFRTISGNHVYDYTYELQLKKEGVVNGNNVKFIVSRTDTNDVNQLYSDSDGNRLIDSVKDMTDSVSQQRFVGMDDSMRFVKESDGIYHVWSYLNADTGDESDGASDYETSVVNGITYNTLTPAENGTLVIKGLDSDTYTFQEIKTEDENNLLASTFSVEIRALDSATDSLRDGRIASAKVTSGTGEPLDITIGLAGVTEGQDTVSGGTNLGIAGMSVMNYDAIDLKTGGPGRWMFYAAGGALAAGIGIGFAVSRKNRRG